MHPHYYHPVSPSALLSLTLLLTLSASVQAIYRGTTVTAPDAVSAFVRFGPATHPHRLVCGGVLITWKHVLTAAHCRLKPRTHRAYIGGTSLMIEQGKGISVNISRVDVHSAFQRTHLTSDIAIITLKHLPSKESLKKRGIRPLRVDWRAARSSDVGKKLFALGFGVTRTRSKASPSPILRNGTIFKLETEQCVRRWYRSADAAAILCAQSKRATTVCSGDSGGPIVAIRRSKAKPGPPRAYLVAVISAVVCRNSGRCCNPGAPVLSMNIEPFKEWVEQRVGKYKRW